METNGTWPKENCRNLCGVRACVCSCITSPLLRHCTSFPHLLHCPSLCSYVKTHRLVRGHCCKHSCFCLEFTYLMCNPVSSSFLLRTCEKRQKTSPAFAEPAIRGHCRQCWYQDRRLRVCPDQTREGGSHHAVFHTALRRAGSAKTRRGVRAGVRRVVWSLEPRCHFGKRDTFQWTISWTFANARKSAKSSRLHAEKWHLQICERSQTHLCKCTRNKPLKPFVRGHRGAPIVRT